MIDNNTILGLLGYATGYSFIIAIGWGLLFFYWRV